MARGKALRSYSASEIARCPDKFDVWAAHQACTLAALSDLPTSMQDDVRFVFNVSGRIPKGYVQPGGKGYRLLKDHFPSLHEFLLRAHDEDPTLFSDDASRYKHMLEDLCSVQSAWRTLEGMMASSVKWSEADFAGKVYNLIRSPPVRQGRLRLQVPISLPQPPTTAARSEAEKRILAPQSVIPDGATFVARRHLAGLSQGMDSAFNTLKEKALPLGKFRHQAALTAKMPDKEDFAFASSLWEDKKPDQTHVDNAWRQNRMATAAAARQCHAFRVDAPVIGLVWGEGKVRAHIDWAGEQGGHVNVYSAPYSGSIGPGTASRAGSHRESGVSRVSTTISALSAVSDFHTWDLSKPASAIAVHLIVRNIDTWTKQTFSKRVVKGVLEVAADEQTEFVAWKHAAIVTKSPESENAPAPSRVKKKPPTESKDPQLDVPVPAAPATRRRRSGLRPRK